jgi:hypothetical protein
LNTKTLYSDFENIGNFRALTEDEVLEQRAWQKTIEHCREYTEQFICPELRPYVYIAGGAIPNIFNTFNHDCEENNWYGSDIDFWLKSIPPKTVRHAQRRWLKDNNFKRITISDEYKMQGATRQSFAYTVKHIVGDKMSILPGWYGHPKENVCRFDMLHVQVYYDCEIHKLTLTQDIKDAIIHQKLILNLERLKPLGFVDWSGVIMPFVGETDGQVQEREHIKYRITKWKERGYKLVKQ